MGSRLAKGADSSKDQPAPDKIKNDRKRGRMCSLQGRFASFARLDCAKRLVAEFSCPVSRSASAHSTAFFVICGLGRMLPKDQSARKPPMAARHHEAELNRAMATLVEQRTRRSMLPPSSIEAEDAAVRAKG